MDARQAEAVTRRNLIFILVLGAWLTGNWLYWRAQQQKPGPGITVTNAEGEYIPPHPTRDCSKGCTDQYLEPVWCKTPDGKWLREGERLVLDDDESYVCARADTWTVVEEPKP